MPGMAISFPLKGQRFHGLRHADLVSLAITPLPRAYTRMLTVPRSIARSSELAEGADFERRFTPANWLLMLRVSDCQTANAHQAQLKRAITQRQNGLAQHAWKQSDQPPPLTKKLYSGKIQPLLAPMSASVIPRQISVSPCDDCYCFRIGMKIEVRVGQKFEKS
jgi:hypothetical protein